MHFNTITFPILVWLTVTSLVLKAKILYNSYLKLSSLPILETTLIFIAYVIMDSYHENLS